MFLHGFLSHSGYVKSFFRYSKLRGPQELRQKAWDCPLRSFDGYRSFFWFLPGFRAAPGFRAVLPGF